MVRFPTDMYSTHKLNYFLFSLLIHHIFVHNIRVMLQGVIHGIQSGQKIFQPKIQIHSSNLMMVGITVKAGGGLNLL